ncbi:MAG: hypothetical protein AAGF74_13680 [Pseudomonadota bacterium]
MKAAYFLIIAALVSGCSMPPITRDFDRSTVTLDTLPFTPSPNAETQATASSICGILGKSAVLEESQGMGLTGKRHIYRCH